MKNINEYKIILKSRIEELINNGYIDEVKIIINEFEEAIGSDVDIITYKGIIAILEKKYYEAESILKSGLELYENNFDLLYNIAYLYEITDNKDYAIDYYKRALINSNNYDHQNNVIESLTNLGVRKDKKTILNELKYKDYYKKATLEYREGNINNSVIYYALSYKYSNNERIKNEFYSIFKDYKQLYYTFDSIVSSEKKRFIILSSCGWGDTLQRMHHIARSLAKMDNDVYYVCPSISIDIDNDDINNEKLNTYSVSSSVKVDNVKIFTPLIAKYNGLEIANNYTELIQQILSKETEINNTIIITYMPYQVEAIKKLKGDFFHIYECVDDHSDLEYAYWGRKQDIFSEQELMDNVDAITTTSTSLYLQRIAIEKRKNVYLSRNAVNEEDFILNDEEDVPVELLSIPEPRIVYTGVVYKRYDEKLFYDIVDSNPDKSFIIIGPVHENMLQEKRKNLYLLGPKKHSDLKRYLKHMQIGIVPYIDSADMDIACDSIKQYEYIACGLPVITTYMPESAIDKIYTYLANNKEEFNKAISICLKHKVDKDKIKEYIIKNSWLSRAVLLCSIADNRITESEQNDYLKRLNDKLELANIQNKYPIIKCFQAMMLNLRNSLLFQKEMEAIYRDYNCKYIEKQYLTSLLENKDYDKIREVINRSCYVKDEIKKEVEFCLNLSDIRSMTCLFNMCVGNVIKAIYLLNDIENLDRKIIYSNYIINELGGDVNYEELYSVSDESLSSPIFKSITAGYSYKEENIILDLFDTVTEAELEKMKNNKINISRLCSCTSGLKSGIRKITLDELMKLNCSNKVIVPYNCDYIKQVRILAESGFEECYISNVYKDDSSFIYIDKCLMKKVKNKEYNKTITFNKFNAADSNVNALVKYVPEEYKKKYVINIINGKDVWNVENIVKVPLISNVTVSGFATFLYYYPHFTYNIEVGHNGVSIKSCGLMDRKDKNSGGNQQVYENADCICIASHLNMILNSAFFGVPENKYSITGLPRNDVLKITDGRKNIEFLLNKGLSDKKIIFNMPTFHKFDQSGRVEGAENLVDSIKIDGFDYELFNSFLKDNDAICISKVHHGEEKSVSEKSKDRKYSNLFFISNEDLDEKGLDLYEIINGGDVLITDYSTIYNDFLFMDKPTIFLTTDIDEYRKERGLALEPYEFWTAGAKITSQTELQEEIIRLLNNKDKYKAKRKELLPVFFQYQEYGSIERVWQEIEKGVNSSRI